MKKGQKSVRAGIQDFLCPFTDMYITQGSMQRSGTHAGLYANDVRGTKPGVRYPYYAPCDLVCIKTYPESGQVMWQSQNKVRFANGRIDYATIMTAHDDSMDSYPGQKISQGSQMGNMGNKGYSTGVHCHIEVSQSKTTSWTKNKYGNYMFPNEYDLDDCYFVDNTNILNGMGGNWKKLSDVKVQEPKPNPVCADQIIKVGSKVRFDGIFKVDILKSPISSNLFGCCKLTGCSYNDYYHEKVKDYHWLPCGPFTECDSKGTPTKDQVFTGGSSYCKNNNIYTVKAVDIPTDSAKININGRDVWVFCKYLYEVSNS